VLHIVQTGRDAIPLDSNDRKRPPSRRRVTSGSAVPGSEPPNEDLFRIAQVLAWMANRATEWGTAVERRRQIPQLLRPLAASLPGGTMLFH
jgi:hypothetical protein